VNVLGAILPGLRDVRTPLAVGYLWILNAWLMWPVVPEGTVKNALAERASTAASLVGGAPSLILGLGLMAYAVGIALGAVSDAAFGALYVFLFIYVVVQTLVILWSARTILVIIAIAVAIAFRYVDSRGKQYDERRRRRILALASELADGTSAILVWLFRYDEHRQRRQRRRFLAILADRAIGQERDVLNKMAVGASRDDTLRIWMTIVASGALRNGMEESGGRHWTRTAIEAEVRRARAASGDVCQTLRSLMTDAMVRNVGIRLAVYEKYLDMDRFDSLLRSELSDLPVRLKSTQSPLYDAWGQLMAEGDFRRGIAAPVAILGPAAWSAAVLGENYSAFESTNGRLALSVVTVLTFGLGYVFGVQGGRSSCRGLRSTRYMCARRAH
jgi:hypothetical protein